MLLSKLKRSEILKLFCRLRFILSNLRHYVGAYCKCSAFSELLLSKNLANSIPPKYTTYTLATENKYYWEMSIVTSQIVARGILVFVYWTYHSNQRFNPFLSARFSFVHFRTSELFHRQLPIIVAIATFVRWPFDRRHLDGHFRKFLIYKSTVYCRFGCEASKQGTILQRKFYRRTKTTKGFLVFAGSAFCSFSTDHPRRRARFSWLCELRRMTC
jgi:hypothetical protein